jgi:hypothetical protein
MHDYHGGNNKLCVDELVFQFCCVLTMQNILSSFSFFFPLLCNLIYKISITCSFGMQNSKFLQFVSKMSRGELINDDNQVKETALPAPGD